MNKKVMTVLLGACSAGALMGGPFQNGSFENPILGGTPDFVTVPTGWTKVDGTGFGLFMQFDTTFGIPFVAANGHQSYGFGGNGATTGSLSQTFDTSAGGSYGVDFQYVIQQGFEFEALQVEVLDGSTVLASNQFTFNNNTLWLSAPTLNFIATSGATTLRFSDVTGALLPGVGFSTNWALDAVAVNQSQGSTGTPEPSTLGLVGLAGLTGAAFRARSLKRKSLLQ